MLQVERLEIGAIGENTYVIVHSETKEALIVDPGGEASRIIEWIEQAQWQPLAILLTHAHYDHIGAVDEVRDHFQVEVYQHPEEAKFLVDPNWNLSGLTGRQAVTARPAEHLWETLGKHQIGPFQFEVVFVPGHSPGHVAYIFVDERFVVSGDTIFEMSIGRTDLPGGRYIQLMQSIDRELIHLPEDYRLYPGHGNSFTVGYSLATNPYFEVFRQSMKHRLS